MTWVVYCIDCNESWGPYIDRDEAQRVKQSHVIVHLKIDKREQSAQKRSNNLSI